MRETCHYVEIRSQEESSNIRPRPVRSSGRYTWEFRRGLLGSGSAGDDVLASSRRFEVESSVVGYVSQFVGG